MMAAVGAAPARQARQSPPRGAAQDLEDGDDLFTLAPELRFEPLHTPPLRAGDCTLHNSFTPHTATAKDDARIGQVVIYIDRDTSFVDLPHPVADGSAARRGRGFPTPRSHCFRDDAEGPTGMAEVSGEWRDLVPYFAATAE
jgi:hypothetical protein